VSSSSFISILVKTIHDLQTARGTGSVDVAYLGNVLRRDGHDWTSHGFERLSAALAQAQADGSVEISRSENGALRVSARTEARIATSHVDSPPASSVIPNIAPTRFRPLRPPVWFAFASAIPDGHQRQINRRTGVVWSDGQRPPGSELDWVPVVPVPEADQRGWAEEFIKRPDVGEDKAPLAEALRIQDWYRRFPAELEKRGPVLVRAWSHLRSTRIIDHVKAWASKNNVDENLLFAAGRVIPAKATSAGPVAATGDLRHALLSVIERMATPELLELRIPVRYVLEAVRPDLLQ
jgi:hypothetical protein